MKRRQFLKTVGASSMNMSLLGLSSSIKNSTQKPNIIIILADDLGYSDTGFTGSNDIRTPNIDSIALNGVNFTNGFVSHPFCSPSRAGLLTGRYQHRFGHECNPSYDPTNSKLGLPVGDALLSDELRKAGYTTGIIGKWHLGTANVFHPNRRGFDEFYGCLHGQHHYFRSSAKGRPIIKPILFNKKPQPHPGYLTEVFSKKAVDFIQRHNKKSFFLYLSYNAVHGPLMAPEKDIFHFQHIKDPKRRLYAAMLKNMDDGIGQVLSTLRQHKLEKDTLIFFLSDNGGDPNFGANNHPLRDGKTTLYEGGIRVPFVAQWLGILPKNFKYNFQVISLDIFATVLSAAGIHPPANRTIDGTDLIPYIQGKKTGKPHNQLFWRINNGESYAVRENRFKLVGHKNIQKKELFDLIADPQEAQDISMEKPEVLQRLKQAYEKWQLNMVPPNWPNRREVKSRKSKL